MEKKKLVVYRTSSDYFQTSFISFFNKLINFESWEHSNNGRIRFGENWANILLDKLDFLQEDEKNFDFHKFVITDTSSKYHKKIRIDKIVAVTLSSHLLAEEIKDLYSDRLGLNRHEEPQLIKLTNYYEFYNEETFNQIENGENVLIVNDVISTGKLNDELYKSLADEGKKANVVAIFSLVDTRMDKTEYDKTQDNEQRVKNYYDNEISRKLVCILHHYIPKYKSLDQIPKEIINGREIEEIRINPVLNAPTPTINKSEQIVKKLIYNDNSPKDKDGYRFLKNIYDAEDSKKSLCVGHIENFGSHHPYFIDTKVLFQSETGKNLIGSLIVDVKNLDNEIIKNRNKTHLTKIAERFERLKTENTKLDQFDKDKIDKLISETNNLKEDIDYKENYDKFDVDFVVHASDSGFDYIKRNEFSTFLQKAGNKNDFQVIRMPRVMMSQEWGIPNIPDSYKYVFENKRILILDSASCTGETLLNLIDSMCYLDVKKITVLSVITRIKDFHGEFLTRIHKINNNRSAFRESSIPIDIYFGAHFNLPHYLANSNQCPHCKEIHDYKEILYKTNPPKSVEDSINYSRQFLQINKINDITSSTKNEIISPYLMSGLDLCRMFQIRDELGKKEHQRTYNKYFKNYFLSDSKLQNVDETYFDELISVFLHEPHLIDTLRREYPKIYHALKIILDYNTIKFIPNYPKNKKFSRKLRLDWDKTSLLFIFSFFFEDEFFVDGKRTLHSDILLDKNFLIKLFKYSEDYSSRIDLPKVFKTFNDEECLNYLAYLIWIRQNHNNIEQKLDHKREIKSEHLFFTINQIRKEAHQKKHQFKIPTRRLLNSLCFHLSLSRERNSNISLNEATYNLYKLFTNIETEGKNHGNLFQKVSKLEKALYTRNYKEIVLLWENSLRIKFQDILIVSEKMKVVFASYKDTSYYEILFAEKNSLSSFFADTDNLVVQIKEEFNNNLFVNELTSELHRQIKIMTYFFFENESPFVKLSSTYYCDVVKLWNERQKSLLNLNFSIIDETKPNEKPIKIEFNINEMIANYLIFSQLEINLKSYAKPNSKILFRWSKDKDNKHILSVRNQKKSPINIDKEDIKSTYNGTDNWKRILPLYGIDVTFSGLLSNDTWFETKFNFK